MKIRTGAALAVVLAVAGAPAVDAAPKPKSCQLVVDGTGDATTHGVVPSRDAIDITSADVATGARNLVGVLRVASLAPDPTLTPGTTYRLRWRAGGAAQMLELIRFSDGSYTSTFDPDTAGTANSDTVAAPVVVDTATNSIVWTLPRKANPALAKKGTKFSSFSATAEAATNIAANNVSFAGSSGGGDQASSGKTYTDLAPSCVKGV